MINKKSIWFLTLFSLILVLSVYYITMPSELLLANNNNFATKEVSTEENNENVTVQESSLLVALRVEAEEVMLEQMNELKKIINDEKASTDEKNGAYEQMKNLNITRGEEEKLEGQINQNYKLKSFVKVNNNQIRVVIDSKEHDPKLANNIMRTIQSNYGNQMYISVKFGA